MTGGFGVYVHWPYCAAICPYCDFNVYRARGAQNAPLLDAVCADIAAHAERFGKRVAASVFLGGGTPSLLRGREIERIIEAVDGSFGVAPDCEITLEANPEDAPQFAEQAAAGVNRFSLGVQALDDSALRALGRRHDSETARAAVETAARTGMRVSLDLIYARQGQTPAAWRSELAEALTLPVEHASLYQLTVEPGTAFERRLRRGDLAPPDDEAAAALYEVTQEVCAAAGLPAYEISNHARGASARARHNLIYWQSGDWAGVGPGAHGRMTGAGVRWALEAQRRPADYIDAVRENGVGWIHQAPLSGEEIADEALLMGLRIEDGVERARIEALRQRPLNQRALTWLCEQGLVEDADGRLRLSARGRLLANRITAELVS